MVEVLALPHRVPSLGRAVERVRRVLEDRWGDASAATWNNRLAAVGSFRRWVQAQGWVRDDPLAGIERRPQVRDDTTPVRYEQLHALWTRPDVHVREKTLWRMLYETAARANEILALNIEDLDLAARRAVVRGKGGHRQEVVWASGTARRRTKDNSAADTPTAKTSKAKLSPCSPTPSLPGASPTWNPQPNTSQPQGSHPRPPCTNTSTSTDDTTSPTPALPPTSQL